MINVNKLVILIAFITACAVSVHAGNPDRAGEAGAYELTINPWARSAGLFGMNSSRVIGLEAERINVAGMALTRKTDVIFARTHWVQGTDIFINTAGVAQKFGRNKADVVGFSFMAFDLGEFDRTTTDNPDPGVLGTFKPQFFNMGISYARAFSNHINAGATVRLVSERIDDLKAFGFCIDLGIMYVTGKLDNARFGISLRNVGTPMKYSGDGLVFRGPAPQGGYQQSASQRTEKFELPSMLNIGVSYDLYADNLKNDKEKPHNHRVSVMFNYTSNSFGKDHVGGGLEYSWKEYFMIRGGYRWEKDITADANRTTWFRGPSAGFSAEMPLKKSKGKESPTLGVDYAYLVTSPFKGTHHYGLRFTL